MHAFYPSHLRNPILEAGSGLNLMRLTYDGVTRTVEPYSLSFRRRQDGKANEYLYVWDRTGGRSGPGIKALFHHKIHSRSSRTPSTRASQLNSPRLATAVSPATSRALPDLDAPQCAVALGLDASRLVPRTSSAVRPAARSSGEQARAPSSTSTRPNTAHRATAGLATSSDWAERRRTLRSTGFCCGKDGIAASSCLGSLRVATRTRVLRHHCSYALRPTDGIAVADVNYRFVAGCEQLIKHYGLLRLGAALGGLLAVLASLGLLRSPEAAAGAIVLAFVSWLFLLILGLFVERNRLLKQMRTEAFILNRYSDSVDRLQTSEYFDIVSWDETISVDAKGHTEILRKFVLRVGANELPAFSTSMILDPAPEKHTYKKRVKFEAGRLREDGSLGTEIPYTYKWEDHKVKIYLHLPRVEPAGAHVSLYLRVKWANYLDALRPGSSIPNEYTFHRMIESFSLKIVLNRDFVDGRTVVTQSATQTPAPTETVNESGDVVIEYNVAQPAKGRTLGFDLGLREKA